MKVCPPIVKSAPDLSLAIRLKVLSNGDTPDGLGYYSTLDQASGPSAHGEYCFGLRG